MNRKRGNGGPREPDAEEPPASYQLHTDEPIAKVEEQVPLSPSRAMIRHPDIFRDESEDTTDKDDDSYEEREMSLQELLYSSSSFYAIVVPGE